MKGRTIFGFVIGVLCILIGIMNYFENAKTGGVISVIIGLVIILISIIFEPTDKPVIENIEVKNE